MPRSEHSAVKMEQAVTMVVAGGQDIWFKSACCTSSRISVQVATTRVKSCGGLEKEFLAFAGYLKERPCVREIKQKVTHQDT